MNFDLNSFYLGCTLGTLILGLLFLWRSYYHVEEGHLAVITRFGKALRCDPSPSQNPPLNGLSFIESDPLRLIQPGGHWKWPWDQVITFSTMERMIDLSGESGGKYAMAEDGTILRLDSKIRFFPKHESIYSYLFELENPIGHIREMFICLIRNEIANFKGESREDAELLGSYSAIRRDRKLLNDQVENICKAQIGDFYGIQFCGVDLLDIVPPHELDAALNGIQNAKTEADTMFARAQGDARQKIVAAEQGVEISRIRAEAITLELESQVNMIRTLIKSGNVDDYLIHRKTELVGNSKMLFMQKEL